MPSSSTAAVSPTARRGTARMASSPDARATARSAGAPPPRHSVAALLDEAVLEGVVGEVAVGLELHLLHHPGPVGAHGLHAERHAVGHVADRLALGESQEDLELALGELLVRRLVGRAAEP